MMSEHINELAMALAKAQGEMRGAKKDTTNPFFKSKYADLASVWEACREALSKNNLAVVQPTKATDHGTVVVTMLLHSSGQWISGEMDVLPKSPDAQALGSAITYARRYALSSMVGIAPEEDDGEGAMARHQTHVAPPRAPTPKPPSKVEPHGDVSAVKDSGYVRAVEFWKMAKRVNWSEAQVRAKLADLFQLQSIKELSDVQFGVIWTAVESNPHVPAKT